MKLIFVLLGLCIPGAHAMNLSLGPPHAATITVTSTLTIAKNGARAYLIIQNNSTTIPVIVKATSVQSANEGIVIAPSGNYEFAGPSAPGNAFYMKTASSTAAITWVEGQ